MNTVNNITEKIISDAQNLAKKIISDAEKMEKEIDENGEKETQKLLKSALEETVKKAESLEYLAKGEAESIFRKRMANFRQEEVKKVLLKALENICLDKSYFENLQKLIIKNALSGSGKLILCEEDNKRKPVDFMKKLTRALDKDKKLILSEREKINEHGFVIEYEKVTVDNTFSSLVKENEDVLTEKISKILFGFEEEV